MHAETSLEIFPSQPALFSELDTDQAPERVIPADKLRREKYNLRRALADDEEPPQLSLTDQRVTTVTAWGTFKMRPYGQDWGDIE